MPKCRAGSRNSVPCEHGPLIILGVAFTLASSLPTAVSRISVIGVKQGFFASLALLLALHAGFSCGTAQAGLLLQPPCCGANCPAPSSTGDRACCQLQSLGPAPIAVPVKPNVPSFQPLAGSIRTYVVTAVPSGFEGASIFQACPVRAAKLALLCSRQI
jgi:hypothetical protein